MVSETMSLPEDSVLSLTSFSLHLGIGSQKFIHAGIGQQVGPVLLQADIGTVPVLYKGTSLSGGLYWISQQTWYDRGLKLGLEFSYIQLQHFYPDGADRFSKILSANAAFLLFPTGNFGLMVKDGIGFVMTNDHPTSDITSLLFFNLEFEICFSY